MSVKNSLFDFKLTFQKIPTELSLFFIFSVFCANLMANKELIRFSFFALDCGTVFSWGMFLCLDIICKKWGTKTSIQISIIALFVNLVFSSIFFILSKLPGNWSQFYVYQNKIINDSLNSTFGNSFYIVFISSVAFLISSSVNAFLNSKIGDFIKRKNYSEFAIRSFISTFFSQFVDNMIFTIFVSKIIFRWNWIQVFICVSVQVLFELLTEIFFSPFGYKYLLSLKD